ncbi:ferrous iron transporter B [Dongia sp.]|uniref:ferrous iron transporter B n=1 Tax=Dongia sp. TaxID=1977262 RepID=UPI0035B21A29
MNAHTAAPGFALVGCPNSGKTALFNALTGSRQKVANYAGVTVERKEGRLSTPGGRRVRILDLPGTYSLRGHSPDEAVARDVMLGRRPGEALPDVLICVADATNLRLFLRLFLEIKQLNYPMILALNMADIAKRQGCEIDIARLSRELGVPVIPTVAVRRGGIDALLRAIDDDFPVLRHDASNWRPPSARDLRATHREADRILRCCSFRAGDQRLSARIDRVCLHPAWGLFILLALLFLIFQAVFAWAAPAMDGIGLLFDLLAGWVQQIVPPGLLRSFIADGLIAGVGSVIIFLPQILILFFFIILLEDSGYMARAAFLMDRLMGGAGLHGRAFLPLLSSFACAIPGIMATRVIENRRDRLATILVAPLMTCSARIPVYTLLVSAFIPDRSLAAGIGLQGLVMFGLYATGILSALSVAAFMKRIVWRQAAEPFLMELPGYKRPRLDNILLGLRLRATAFLRRAGTIILGLSILMWFACSFPQAPIGAGQPAINYSLAGIVGHALADIFAPIGFNWEIVVALIPGLAAREVAVGALATVYAVGAPDGGADTALQAILAGRWSLPTGLSLLAWYVFAPQCLSTLAVVKRETMNWFWPAVMFVYMMFLAYAAAYATFRISSLISS